jgi:predicted lipid-binding transport protein (Tim44 family)
MKLAAITGALVPALAAGSVATPSFAQPYGGYGYQDPCQSKTHQSGTTGAIVGGLAGALLGSSLAGSHDGRTGGALIGAVAGAALGNNIGRSNAKSSCNGYVRQGYYGSSYNSGYARNGYARDGYYDNRSRARAPVYAYDRRFQESAYRDDDRRW